MIVIDYQDRTPIYEQIVERLQTLIIKGVLSADEQLPSVRKLAVDLSINHNTIQRAFALLEQQGYEVQVLEFIDMEHTPKNILIRAVKKKNLKLIDAAGRKRETAQAEDGSEDSERKNKAASEKQADRKAAQLERTLEELHVNPTLKKLLTV